MALHAAAEVVRTGLRRQSNRHPGMVRQRKAAALTVVKSPVLATDAPPTWGWRAKGIDSPTPYNLADIGKMYLVDPIVRQGVDKYAEIILKEGYWLLGDEAPVRYLERRFETMMRQTGEMWSDIVEAGIRDFVKYGNCMFAVVRANEAQPIGGMLLKSQQGTTPIGALFNLPVEQMTPQYAKDSNRLIAWRQTLPGTTTYKDFPAKDVLHFTYCRKPGSLWGTPHLASVIEDVRALRQMEDNILRLVDKHLNPLIHQEVPDLTHTGEGRQEDVDDAVFKHQQMARDGFLITPPGHKITVLGTESKALRVDSYLRHFKMRVYAGLGISELIMGESKSATAGSADALTMQMHHRAKFYQATLSGYFTNFILNELLLEGGFDPYNFAEDRVTWVWNELEIDRKIKEEIHAFNGFTMNVLTQDEVRAKCGKSVLTPEEEAGLYVNKVQIPQLTAVHRLLREEIQIYGDDSPGNGSQGGLPPGKVPVKSITKMGKQGQNADRPANQHGYKFSPGAPRAHKMMADVCLWAESFAINAATSDDLRTLLLAHEGYSEALFRELLVLASLPDLTYGLVRIQQTLLQEPYSP